MTLPRAKLDHPPIRILAALRHAGGVMLGVRAGPALLERMGPIEQVEEQAGTIRCLGGSHDLTLSADAVTAIVLDRTMTMRDRVLPRAHFLGSDGKPLVSATSLDDAEAFEAALASFGPGEPLPGEPAPPREAATAEADDPAAAPLRTTAGRPVTLAVERPGVLLRRTGTLPEPMIAMGFVNLILPDCHLHLRGGTIAGWTREEDADGVRFWAADVDGAPIGLTLRA